VFTDGQPALTVAVAIFEAVGFASALGDAEHEAAHVGVQMRSSPPLGPDVASIKRMVMRARMPSMSRPTG
jgi:hypothetical protein